MDDITSLSKYIIGAVGIILLPGPNSLYCLSVAAQYGRKAAAGAIAGILLGDTVLILATVLGAATLLKTYPPLFSAVKMVGGAYLAYVALGLLQAAWFKYHHPERQSALKPVSPRAFRKALLLSLTNPKAILFFLSFFVAFVKPSATEPLWAFTILGAILQLISLLYLCLLAVLGWRLSAWFAGQQKLASAGLALVGMLFLFFSFGLWTSSL